MFKNYLKVMLRNLYRDKLYALINLSGLSLGLACCMILGLYLQSELTYDQHHEKHKRIFRIAMELNTRGKIDASSWTSWGLGPLLARDYPQIEAYVRFIPIIAPNTPGSGNLYRYEDKAFYSRDVYVVDENVFDVFTHRIICGDPETALSLPTSMAISESFAKKIFGSINPIGKTVRTDMYSYQITLVYSDCPENSHLKYDALISINRANIADDTISLRNQVFSLNAFTYLLMPEDFQASSFKAIADEFYKTYMEPIGEQVNVSAKFWLQPLAGIHLESDLLYDRPTGNKFYVYGFAAVAGFILLVACINYMNLATARSLRRSREVGMRKVLGASRSHLIFQFLSESIFFSLLAAVISAILVEAIIQHTPIHQLMGKQYLPTFADKPELLWWALSLSLFAGLISGLYPAIYLSSIRSLSALTVTKKSGKENFRFRQVLVFIQFTISICVIACTMLMVIQLHFISNKPLGFNKDNKLLIRLHGADLIEKTPTIKNELLKCSGIYDVTLSRFPPGQGIGLSILMIENNDGSMGAQSVFMLPVGENFLMVMDIPLVAGRDFSKRLITDIGNSFVVNEAMVKKMGWAQPLGKRIQAGPQPGRVIGVVKDYHHRSLHETVDPLIMNVASLEDLSGLSYEQRKMLSWILILHISEDSVQKTLSYIGDIFSKFDPIHPFDYEFLDDALDKLYMSEDHLMKLTAIFSGICIFISCLGLFGLSAFTTEQRTKEIGIRKVLGASSFQIILMLSLTTLLLILGASIIGSIIAYFAIENWLADFAFKAAVNPLVFLLSALTALAVAFLTVALQSFKTAQDNPVNALRYE